MILAKSQLFWTLFFDRNHDLLLKYCRRQNCNLSQIKTDSNNIARLAWLAKKFAISCARGLLMIMIFDLTFHNVSWQLLKWSSTKGPLAYSIDRKILVFYSNCYFLKHSTRQKYRTHFHMMSFFWDFLKRMLKMKSNKKSSKKHC